MKRFYKTKCLVALKEISDLGIKQDPEFVDCYIDLDEIESFHYDEDHNDNECVQLKFKSGDQFTISESIHAFQNVLLTRGILAT